MELTPTDTDTAVVELPAGTETHDARPAHAHAVQFYADGAFLCSAAADVIAPAVLAGRPVVAITTPTHGELLLAELRTRGVDVAEARAAGRMLLLDARTTLARFMDGPRPDAARFRRVIGETLRTSARSGLGGQVVFGEMVDLLCQDGNADAAIRVEQLWNAMAEAHPFALLCGYSMGSFRGEADGEAFAQICRLHVHASPTEHFLKLNATGQPAEVARLQQRAEALEQEIVVRRRLEQELRATIAERDAVVAREREAREEAESANRTKGEFLAVMSHELRTPLNAIAGYAELLELGVHGALSEPQRETISRIQRSQRHLLALITEVLSYARMDGGQMRFTREDVLLKEVVRTAEEQVAHVMREKQIRYDRAELPAGLTVLADYDKLQQVLLNLLTNATKYTEFGGRVWTEIDVGASVVRIRVCDTGIGIAPEKLEAIFEPFVQLESHLTRAHGGIGLGLAISRSLACGMGGDLEVESEPGRGSAFTVSLPRG